MSTVTHPTDLLERAAQLETLAESYAAVAATSRGRLALVYGEAGIGKTALVRRFCDEHAGSARVLWGACEALFTPHPLGPILDIAAGDGAELTPTSTPRTPSRTRSPPPSWRSCARTHPRSSSSRTSTGRTRRRSTSSGSSGAGSRRAGARRRHLPRRPARPGAPAADRARGAGDERAVTRLDVGPLSQRPSPTWPRPTGSTQASCTAHRRQPFLRHRGPRVRRGAHPGDRSRRGTGPGRAPEPRRADGAGSGGDRPSPGRALAAGRACRRCGGAPRGVPRLRDAGRGGRSVAFRHELARLAVQESLPPTRRLGLHRAALQALSAPAGQHPTSPGSPTTPRRRVTRTPCCVSPRRLRRTRRWSAPIARRRRRSPGRCASATASRRRAARLLERLSSECYLTDQSAEAIAALEALRWGTTGRSTTRKEGAALCALSRPPLVRGRAGAGRGDGARGGLDTRALPAQPRAGDRLQHGLVGSHERRGRCRRARVGGPGARAGRAIRRQRDPSSRPEQHRDGGSAERGAGRFREARRSLGLAREERLEEHVGRALIHLAWVVARTRRYDLAWRVDEGIDYCAEHGLDLWWLYLLAFRARVDLDCGRWTEAANAASLVLGHPRGAVLLRILALAVLGLVRARRRDPDHRGPLDEALELTRRRATCNTSRRSPSHGRRQPGSEGDRDAVAAETDSCLAFAIDREASWVVGELAYWRWQAGVREAIPADAAEPYAPQMRGDWRGAAELWHGSAAPTRLRSRRRRGGRGERPGGTRRLRRLGGAGAADVARGARGRVGSAGCRAAHARRPGQDPAT